MGRTALIPYLTAGFPNVKLSLDALRVIDECADMIEVGVPFSDPIADGPTIQASTFRALQNGMSLAGTLELVGKARLSKPVVLFSYLNPVLQYGAARLASEAQELGVRGILLTDLPSGADQDLEDELANSPLDLIRLVAPTSDHARVAGAVANAQGFIYMVARLGVTGMSTELAEGLEKSIGMVREATPLPIAVGFGISTASQARQVAGMADGVVVGSALVSALDTDGVTGVSSLMQQLRAGIDGG